MRLLLVAVAALCLSSAAARSAAMHDARGAVFSPDGSQVAWYDGRTGQVFVAATDGTDARRVGKPFGDEVAQIAWTRYGLIVDSSYTFFRLNRIGERTKIGIATDVDFSLGGSRIASGTGECGICTGPVRVFDISTHVRYLLGAPANANSSPALSPDGSHVVYTRSTCGPPSGECGNNPVFIEAAVTGRGTRRLPAAGGCTGWSPNGRWLVYSDRRGVSIMNLATGAHRLLYRRFPNCIGGALPAWSPDSTRIALATAQGTMTVVNARTGAVLRTARSVGEVASFAWAPDGKSLIVSSRPGPTYDCFSLWRLDAATLQGSVVVRGCP